MRDDELLKPKQQHKNSRHDCIDIFVDGLIDQRSTTIRLHGICLADFAAN